MDAITLRRRIAAQFRLQGMQQAQIADVLGVSAPTISQDLATNPKPLTAGDVLLAGATGAAGIGDAGIVPILNKAGIDMQGDSSLRHITMKAALTSSGVPVTTTGTPAPTAPIDWEGVMRSLFTVFDAPAGAYSFSVPTSEPIATDRAENGVRVVTAEDRTFRNSPKVAQRTAYAASDITDLLSIQDPGILQREIDLLESACMEHIMGKVVGALDTGLLGPTTPDSVHVEEVASASLSFETSFRAIQDAIAVKTPLDSPAFLCSEALYRRARKTQREPGSDRRVASPDQLLDERLVRLPFVSEERAAWSSSWRTSLAVILWETRELTIDRITTPGTVKLTFAVHYNWYWFRPERVAILREE